MAKVIVLLKDGFEEVEALTVVDYLRRADIEVETVSTNEHIYAEGAHKIIVKADTMFDDLSEDFDLIYVPGGMPGAKDLSEDKRVLDLISKHHEKGKPLVAICAAPIVLEAAGVLKGKTVTSYPGFDKDLESIGKYSEDLVVVDENIITSRAAATAGELSFKLIELLKGKEKAKEISDSVLYDRIS